MLVTVSRCLDASFDTLEMISFYDKVKDETFHLSIRLSMFVDVEYEPFFLAKQADLENGLHHSPIDCSVLDPSVCDVSDVRFEFMRTFSLVTGNECNLHYVMRLEKL